MTDVHDVAAKVGAVSLSRGYDTTGHGFEVINELESSLNGSNKREDENASDSM